MTSAADLTLVVPTLGRSPWLQRCLHALRADGGAALELVVVCPATLDLTMALSATAAPAPRRIETSEPVGFAAALNHGFAFAERRPFFGTVNDDALIEPGWCAALLAALDARPNAAAAQGCNLIAADDALEGVFDGAQDGARKIVPASRVDSLGIEWNRWSQAVQIGHGQALDAVPDTLLTESVFGVSATAAIYRRTALEQVAGGGLGDRWCFDPLFESYYEDVDLAVRLRASGWDAIRVGGARAYHLGSVTGREREHRRQVLLVANRWLTLRRAWGPRLLLNAPRLLLRDLAAVFKRETSWFALGQGWLRFVRLASAIKPLGRAERAALPVLRATRRPEFERRPA